MGVKFLGKGKVWVMMILMLLVLMKVKTQVEDELVWLPEVHERPFHTLVQQFTR